MSARGMLIVISAPSGTGKGTVITRLLERDPRLSLSLSATTRAMRPGDVDGVTYRFVSEEAFERMISEGALLEYAGLYGKRYGTPREAVERRLTEGFDVLLEIDTQGGIELIKREHPLSIFILPPSMAELKRRLLGRGTESAQQVERRAAFAYEELKNARNYYRYCIVNDDIVGAACAIEVILRAERGDAEASAVAQAYIMDRHIGRINQLLEEKI